MKNLLLASVALIALGSAPVFAQDADAKTDAAVGSAAGGATGAVVGVEADSVEYVRLNPTEPVVIDGDIDVGFVVPEDIEIHTIETDPDHGYFYTEDRVYFVDLSDRTVVYSPGTVVAVESSN